MKLTSLRRLRSIFHGLAGAAIASLVFGVLFISSAGAQNVAIPLNQFRIGEKITYIVSVDRYPVAGHAELQVVSRGKINNRDVIELSGKFKTTGLFSAQKLIDETMISLVAPESGLPLFAKRTNLSAGSPIETVNQFLEPTNQSSDILASIYRIRYSFTGGGFNLVDGDRSTSASYIQVGTETVKVEAGEFDTTIYEIQSEALAAYGIQSVRVNIDNTGNRVPVMFRFKIEGGELFVKANSIQLAETPVSPTPTPVPILTPITTPNPVATPAPDVYIDNRPLANEIPFALGEKIEYDVKIGNQQAGRLTLHARERKRFNSVDSLLLTATVTNAQSGFAAFALNDRMTVQVDPLTLLPQKFDTVFTGNLAAFSQSATFNNELGKVIFGGANAVDVPVGTHSILSLLYAMRSFRLAPSKVLTDPVNDTRVAVFWGQKPHVFVIRPTLDEVELADGTKIETVVASITTGEPLLDQLQPKVWISQDARRLPVRIQLGIYRFDIGRNSIEIP